MIEPAGARPNPAQRNQVEALVGLGVSDADIAKVAAVDTEAYGSSGAGHRSERISAYCVSQEPRDALSMSDFGREADMALAARASEAAARAWANLLMVSSSGDGIRE